MWLLTIVIRLTTTSAAWSTGLVDSRTELKKLEQQRAASGDMLKALKLVKDWDKKEESIDYPRWDEVMLAVRVAITRAENNND